jgi:hypothetical protein
VATTAEEDRPISSLTDPIDRLRMPQSATALWVEVLSGTKHFQRNDFRFFISVSAKCVRTSL